MYLMRFVRSRDGPEEQSEGNSWNWFHKAGMWEQSQNNPHDQHPRLRAEGRLETKLAGWADMLVPGIQGIYKLGKKWLLSQGTLDRFPSVLWASVPPLCHVYWWLLRLLPSSNTQWHFRLMPKIKYVHKTGEIQKHVGQSRTNSLQAE